MQSVRQIARLNDLELQKCVPPNASWHTDYRDTAYIHIGGLPFELSEGDILTIFSQYGNPVHLNLARDKETGKSRGFAFLKYEDQRSCDLAVDNLSGAGVLGRVLGVDHCRYQLKEGEVEGIPDEDVAEDAGDDTDREGDARRKKRRRSHSESESESEEEHRRPLLKEEAELAKLLREHDEDDPMKNFLVQEKKDEVAEALKRLEVSKKDGKGKDRGDERKRRHHRSRRHGSDDEDEERRGDRHRSRRHGEKDEKRSERHRSRRVEDGEGENDKHRSRRDVDDQDRSNGRQRSERYHSSDDEHGRRRDDRKHRREEGEGEHRKRRDRSREDHRTRRD
jgi:RNA-binding motif X-linked protein 2